MNEQACLNSSCIDEVVGLKFKIIKLETLVRKLVKVSEHYAGEPFDTNDIYLDVFGLITFPCGTKPTRIDFDSDSFAFKARQAQKLQGYQEYKGEE